MREIEQATTKELITELLGRSTFQGLILHLDNHLIRPGQMALYTIERARLTTDQALEVLQSAHETIDRSTWGQVPDSF